MEKVVGRVYVVNCVTILRFHIDECLSCRVGGGFWRRGGETPSAVKWEYRIIEIREGSWSYVAGSIGRAPVQRRLWPLQHQRNMQRSY
ncbi:hypothetical protein P8452_07264 [Trifolium repens]|nr:hypothetical protein QL285_062789 [Trifolium repens]WJX17335.1 hypothetical protein P8452_07264 [Trifolium repens]